MKTKVLKTLFAGMITGMISQALVAETLSTKLDAASDKLDQANALVDQVANVIRDTDFESKPKFYISINLIASQMNAEVNHPTAAAAIDNSAYHLEANMVWNSKKDNIFGTPNGVKAYYAFHALKNTTTGYDDSYWAEKTRAYYFAYGEKYYLNEGYKGFGVGWYGGIGMGTGENPYYWYSSTGPAYSYIGESELAVVVAGEVFYHMEFDKVYVAPRILAGIDQNTGEFSFWPQLMVGVVF